MTAAVQMLDVSLEDWVVVLRISVWLILLAILLGCATIAGFSGGRRRWRPQEVRFAFGAMKARLVPDDEVARIAHQAWTELATRKAGIPVEDDDVIVEVYDSWYALFRALRQLAKEVPVSTLHRSSDAKILLESLLATLNDGLRPHLTKYQAKFRSWWETSAETHPEMSPQDRQRMYSEYEDLMDNMRRVNQDLMELAATLRKLAHERESISLYRRIIERIRSPNARSLNG